MLRVTEAMKGPLVLDVRIDRHEYDGSEIIAGLEFAVKASEIVALMAPSGAGKSTLVRLVLGLERPSVGTCHLKVPGYEIGVTFQEDNLLPWLTAWENALLQKKISGRPVDEQRVSACFDDFGLSPFKSFFPASLSTGMKQMVALTRLLSSRPRLYVLDEAVANIDEMRRQKFLAELREIIKKDCGGGLMITHNPGDALQLADRVLIGSARPLRILKIFGNPLPHNRDRSAVFSPEFGAACRELGQCLEIS